MKRQLCIIALFALALVPDWASACWPGRSAPIFPRAQYRPVYTPVYCQPVYVQPCVPMMVPPRVETVRPRPGTSRAPATQPTRPAVIEQVRPTAAVEAPKVQQASLEVAPPPVAIKPKQPLVAVPPVVPDPKLTPLEPITPDATLSLPQIDMPKIPPLNLPGTPAIPETAPAPDALIPTPTIPLPKVTDTLPPLTLPPDTPVAPDSKPTVAKSSPLAAAARELKVSVFPATGTASEFGLRKIGFYNHTDRDLSLTIEGKMVTLPAKTYLHAQMPPNFTWKYGDNATTNATVPADATGLDVLFRE